MFSQWNDRISSLETIVSQLQTSILELKEENTRMKEQIAQIPVREEKNVKLLEEEPPVEVFIAPGRRSKQADELRKQTDELRKQAHKYLSELPFSV